MRYLLVSVLILLANLSFGQENWLIDMNGCKVYNPYPRDHESVEWTGDCVDSVATGEGQLIWYLKGKKTENVYSGTMVNGRPEGEGKYVYSFGRILQGKYKEGKIFFGTELLGSKKDSTVYIGDYEDDIPNGTGTILFADGDSIIGQIDNYSIIEGIYITNDHGFLIESSDWDGYIPRSGKMILENGTEFDGELKYFLPHGRGTMTFGDGRKIHGIWKKGNLRKEF